MFERLAFLWFFACALLVGSLLLPASGQALTLPTLNFPHAANSSSPQGMSKNWSGYIADNATYTGISGNWTVSKVVSHDIGADATWIGIGGVATHDLIQTGTQATINRQGRVSFEAFYETLPQTSRPLDLRISSGDSISASVIQTAENRWTISFKDNSTNFANLK